ncbi:MAG: hypothetical protein CSA62_09245 [Planctomycetota bacterium]|nr:MAG: hypothetical protein CSA62_09245 [Planctomycetota bacterium]
MRSTHRILSSFVVAGSLALAGCSGGGAPGDSRNIGPFNLTLASTGLGQIYPYRIAQLDAFGLPSTTILNVSSKAQLNANMTQDNGLLPPATWSTTAKLPNGNPGNQFLLLRFSHDLKASSILSNLASNQTNSGLTGAIQLLIYNPATEVQATIRGRGFVGGYTYYDNPSTPEFDLTLTQAVSVNSAGTVTVLDQRAAGFPLGFDGDKDLVSPKSFVFVPDLDGNLSTQEAFADQVAAGSLIRMIVGSSVLDFRDKPLAMEVSVATTPRADTVAPDVLGYSKVATKNVGITPGNGQTGVRPTTPIRVSFTKPVQPRDVGEFLSRGHLVPAIRGVSLNAKIATVSTQVLYYAEPVSMGDFMNYIVTPASQFPSKVEVTLGVNATIHDLTGQAIGHPLATTYTTGVGPGIVNAPVSPEVIYVGRAGANAGVSVIDLNGFGQGTGNINDTNWPNNPNIGKAGVSPILQPGRTNFDAGGRGALTLTQDSNLNDRLIDRSTVTQVGDIHIGQPLDKIYNNSNINGFAWDNNQVNPLTGGTANAWGNSISIAPHPNPPRLVFPPANPAFGIWGEEPSVKSSGPAFIPGEIMTSHPPVGPCRRTPINLLVRGNPHGSATVGDLGIYGGVSNGVFHGPQPAPGTPTPSIPFCQYTSRQQVGHFLYVLDRGKKQIIVLNSNRFTVLETIRMADPYSMAISPNLKRLTVTNFSSNRVSVVDIDPVSTTFHQVVQEVRVGKGPTGIAWQPEGEDCLVVNQLDNSISILRGTDMEVRKTVSGFINEPIELAITPRQGNIGFSTGIYFAYVLNRNGSIAVFESGPDGVNGIGFDDLVGIPRNARFSNATTLQVDIQALSSGSAIWVCHTSPEGDGQVSHFELTSSPTGPKPINSTSGGGLLPPTFREREWSVTGKIGGRSATTPVRDLLSGKSPIDIASDNLLNYGANADARSTIVSNLTYADHSGKSMVKAGNIASRPRMLFIALGDTGKVDVVELDTGKVIRRISVPGVTSVTDYWRQ